MNTKKLFILLLFIFTLLPIVSADLIPSTAPCWVKGTVTGLGVTVEGLTVEAYEGSTLLKSGVIASGIYDLNSVGANDGDTIDLKVYGATFDSFTFEGYCDTSGDPWVVEDFTVSKQANGVSCSNAEICTSGYCTNNVCADATVAASPSSTPDRKPPSDSTPPPVVTTTNLWNEILPGIPNTMNIDNEEIPISLIIFLTDESGNNVKLVVSKHTNKPILITETPNGIVYQYLEITKVNINQINSATISFEITESWLNELGIFIEDVVLFHYKDGIAWEELPTTFIGKTGSVYNFESVTGSFSYFAIGSKEVVQDVTSTTTEETIGENIPEETTSVETKITEPPKSTTEKIDKENIVSDVEESSNLFTIILIILLITSIIGGIWYYKYKIE